MSQAARPDRTLTRETSRALGSIRRLVLERVAEIRFMERISQREITPRHAAPESEDVG